MKKCVKTVALKFAAMLSMLTFATFCIWPVAEASTTVSSASVLATMLSSAGTETTEITFGANVTTNGETLVCSENSDIVIDLNGKTLTLSDYRSCITANNADLTIKNGTVIMTEEDTSVFTVENGSTLTLENVVASTTNAGVIYVDNATVVLNGVNLTTNAAGVLAIDGTSGTVKDGEGNSVTNGSTVMNTYIAPTSSDTKETNLTATVVETYLITVPESIDFGMLTYTDSSENRYVERTGTIKLDYFISDGDNSVKVSVKGSGDEGAFALKSGSNTLNYTVKNSSNSNVAANGVVAQFATAGQTTFKTVIDRQDISHAGVYTGKLIFDITID